MVDVFEECTLIPYTAAAPEALRLAVLAPHPDDETIGCGGLSVLVSRSGGAVRFYVLTDGAAGNFSGSEEGAAYAATRRSESERAAGRLGVPRPVFLEFPDRSLKPRVVELVDRLRPELERFRPDAIAAPSPADTHPDHRAAAKAAFELATAGAAARLLFYEVSAPLAPNRLFDIDPVEPEKRAALAEYTSQMRERPFDELIFGLHRYRAMTLPVPTTFAEGYFEISSEEAKALGFAALARRIGPDRPEVPYLR